MIGLIITIIAAIFIIMALIYFALSRKNNTEIYGTYYCDKIKNNKIIGKL